MQENSLDEGFLAKQQSIKPNRKRRTSAIWAIWAMIGATTLITANRFMLLRYLKFPGTADANYIFTLNSISIGSSVVYSLGFICSIIIFLRWFRRAYYNLQQLFPDEVTSNDALAVGAWFIPFYNLVKPYRIFTEIIDLSFKWDGNWKNNQKQDKIKNFLAVYWVLFIVQGILFRLSRVMAESLDFNVLGTSYLLAILAGICFIVCGIALIRILKSLGQREDYIFDKEGSLFYEKHITAQAVVPEM